MAEWKGRRKHGEDGKSYTIARFLPVKNDEETARLPEKLYGVYAYEKESSDLFIVFDKESGIIKKLYLGMNMQGADRKDFKKEDYKAEESLSLAEYSGFLLRERGDEIIVIPRGLVYQDLDKVEDEGIIMSLKIVSPSVLMIGEGRYFKQ